MLKKVVLFFPSSKFGGSVQARVELPLSLLAIGTPLDRAGYEVRIIDQRVDRRWRETLARELASGPVCLGTTSMTGPQIQNALEASRLAKARGGVPVVWGGIHATLLPRQTIANEHVDIVVQGEGEETFFELVGALENGTPLHEVKGLWFKQDGDIKSTGARPLIDLNQQPPLSYHLVNLRDYLIQVNGRGHVSLETSRGCPFQCSYCYNCSVYYGGWRGMSPDEVVRRVRILTRDHGVKGILLTDDNFFGNRERALEILLRLGEEYQDLLISKMDGHISTLATLSERDLAIVKKSGCQMLMIGVESGSPRIQQMLNKQMDFSDLMAFNRRLRGTGIRPLYFFMMGFPTETIEDLKETLALKSRLSDENPESVPRLNIFTPFPGTAIYEACLRHGFTPPTRLEDWVSFNYRTVNARATWLSEKQKKIIRMLHFMSVLAERNNFIRPYKKTPLWVRLVAGLFYPVARFRMKHLLCQFPVEMRMAEWIGVYPKQEN